MDRQAFKQRMQNLKSYRENNPGKGYWDWKVEAFQDGGQTGDPEKERFYQATGRSSSGRPLEEGLKPVFSIEDAANMTPIGDAISVKDTYDAVKNRGKFNALKKRTGKTTEELTHSKNPLTRKRAIFAQNAKKWKHNGRKKK